MRLGRIALETAESILGHPSVSRAIDVATLDGADLIAPFRRRRVARGGPASRGVWTDAVLSGVCVYGS